MDSENEEFPKISSQEVSEKREMIERIRKRARVLVEEIEERKRERLRQIKELKKFYNENRPNINPNPTQLKNRFRNLIFSLISQKKISQGRKKEMNFLLNVVLKLSVLATSEKKCSFKNLVDKIWEGNEKMNGLRREWRGFSRDMCKGAVGALIDTHILLRCEQKTFPFVYYVLNPSTRLHDIAQSRSRIGKKSSPRNNKAFGPNSKKPFGF